MAEESITARLTDAALVTLARIGVAPEAVAEALRIRQLGADAARGTLSEAASDRLDALRGRSLREVLVAQGVLLPPAGDELDTLLRELEIPGPASPALTRLRTTPPDAVAGPRGGPSFRLGRYEIRAELGRGGMGVAYRAYDPELGREVALKVMLAGDHAGAEEGERFRREARAAARLAHPNLVPVYDVGTHEGRPYFAMELVTGGSLAGWLRQIGPLPPHAAFRLIRDVSEGMAAAHAHGIVHRDLKPENVLLDVPANESESGACADRGALLARLAQARPKVSDFGLAREVRDGAGEAGRTATGVIMGTPAYMAPEQAAGRSGEIDQRADVYALGAVLYELLTGRPPYSGGSAMEVVLRKLEHDPPSPRVLRADLARDAETIVQTAMAREPARRYASARELAEDLGHFLAGEAIRARPESPAEKVVRWVRRRKLLVGLTALALAATIGAALATGSARAAAREQEVLRARVLLDLRDKARLYLDASLKLRRHGAPAREFAGYLQDLEAVAVDVARIDPTRPEPHEALGALYRASLRFPEALVEQERALTKAPDHAPSRYERAVLLAQALDDRQQDLLRAAWREEGARRAGRGDPDRSAAPVPDSVPATADLVEADPAARGLRDRLLADLARLEELARADPALLPGAKLDCIRGMRLALTARTRADADRAREPLERAVAADPRLVEAHQTLANLSLSRREYAQTTEIFSRGLAGDPGYVPFWIQRARIRQDWAVDRATRGEDAEPVFAEADADLSRALELDAESAEAWLRRGALRNQRAACRGDAAAARKIFVEADSDLREALARRPNWPEALDARGSALMNRAVIERPPEALPYLLEAEACLDRALRLDGLDPVRWETRALVHYNLAIHVRDPREQQERTRRCEADFNEALRLDPRRVQGWCGRADIRDQMAALAEARGEDPTPLYEAAAADYAQGGVCRPDFPAPWIGQGKILGYLAEYRSRQGQDPEPALAAAIEACGKALALNPNSVEALERRANLRKILGAWRLRRGNDPNESWTQARADLDAALALDPGYLPALQRRGDLLGDWGSQRRNRGEDPTPWFEAACRDFARGLELRPEDPRMLQARGVVEANWGAADADRGRDPGERYRAAERDYGRALEVDAHSPEGWIRRGVVRANWASWRAGRGEAMDEQFQAAVADYDRALAINPRSADALRRRGSAHLLWGNALLRSGSDPEPQYDAAESDYRAALVLEPGATSTWGRLAALCANRAIVRQGSQRDPEPAFQAAEAAYDKVLEGNPRSVEALVGRGILLKNWGGWRGERHEEATSLLARAVEDLSRALELNPRHAEGLATRGLAYLLQERWADALADFDEAERLDPNQHALIAGARETARQRLERK